MYFKRRIRKEVPGLNTTSTADISFMLLIFFLVTSSMDTDKGLPRQLPPPEDNTEEQRDVLIKERNVLALELGADGQLTCNGERVDYDLLTERVETFVANTGNDPSLPEKSVREVHLMGRCEVSDRHVITVKVSRDARYDDYFQMQNAIVRGYNHLRNQLAQSRFGHSLAQCTPEEHDAIALVYPQRISELPPNEQQKGGETP